MRPGDCAEEVMGVIHIGDPVPQRFVDSVFQSAGSRLYRHHLGTQQPHPGDVERLALGVHLAHVDHALQSEQCACGRGCDAVLARAGLRDHPRFPHPFGEQCLAQNVVDFVGSGVVEVLAFEHDPAPASMLGEPGYLGDRRGPAGVVREQAVQPGDERRIRAGRGVDGGELVEGGNERLGHEPAAIASEVTMGIRLDGRTGGRDSLDAGHSAHRAGFGQAGWDPAVTSWVTAAFGSPLVTSPSPTSTASAPAPA